MTHALNAAEYQPPHVPAGSPSGGQFGPTGGGKAPAKTAPKKTARPAARPAAHDNGTLGFDAKSNHGTGYGSPNGDPRVHRLQQALNRLGMTDADGKALKLDGKLGPKTTAAVEKAQKELGLPVDGKVTPALLARLTAAKAPTKHVPAPAKHAPAKAPAKHAPAKTAPAPVVKHVQKKAYASADLKGVEVARPGTWHLASGELTVTLEMLADAARYAQRPGARPSPVKLGHSDPRFSGDGEPALGWLGNLRVEDDNGPVLVGDITGMPDWLAAAAPTAWPDRSMEGWTDYEDGDETYSLVVDGLALLGVTPPGMSSIRSLRDLPQALGVAASARIVARAPGSPPGPTPTQEAPPSAGLFAAQTPALEAVAPTQKESLVDPVKIREALDLQSDASEDEVIAALATAGLAPPVPEPVAASRVAVAPGTMHVDASAWQEREDRLARLEAAAAKTRQNERDQIIASAVKDGKFPPARREHWVRLWDADPEGAREVIASLAKGVVPVEQAGYGTSDEEHDAEYASLFPPTSTRKGA